MVYMTFKIKRDWLFYVLITVSLICNLVALLMGIQGIGNKLTALSIFGFATFAVLLLINGYAIWNIIKHYKIGLTKDSIRITDFSRVEIPYNKIRSIKKEREPSKYGLYDALLVIKYNKFDTVKINVHDLENVFDNLKEMVQKANLDKIVNSVVTNKDGSREIQQNIPASSTAPNAAGMAGATVIIPASTAPTGSVIVNPNATTATVVRPTSNQPTAGAMVRPAQQRPVQANAGPVVGAMTNQQTAGAMVRPSQQQTAGTLVRPSQNANQQVVRSVQPTAGAMVRPAQAAQPATINPATTVASRTTTTTTTTNKPADQVAQPGSTQSVVINPDGSRRIVTTTTTVK